MDLKKIILSEASKIVAEEKLDEIESIAKINDLVSDAILEEPTTELGKAIRERALEINEHGIKSPFMGFNYNKLRDETTFVAVREAMNILGKYENLIFPMEATDEIKKKIDEDYNTCVLELFKILNKHKIGLQEYPVFFGSMVAIIKSLEQYVNQQIEGHKHEIFSRVLGAKNPGTDKFDANYATYQNLTDLLEKSRKETGDKLEDYFNKTNEKNS